MYSLRIDFSHSLSLPAETSARDFYLSAGERKLKYLCDTYSQTHSLYDPSVKSTMCHLLSTEDQGLDLQNYVGI